MVEAAVFEDLIPSTLNDDVLRTDRLLLVFSMLDDRAQKAFFDILNRQNQFQSEMKIFCELYVKYNGGVCEDTRVAEQMTKLIQHLSNKFADSKKCEAHLESFVKMNDQQAIKLMRRLLDRNSEHRLILKTLVLVYPGLLLCLRLNLAFS